MVRAMRVEERFVGAAWLPHSFDWTGAAIGGRLRVPLLPIVSGVGQPRKFPGFMPRGADPKKPCAEATSVGFDLLGVEPTAGSPDLPGSGCRPMDWISSACKTLVVTSIFDS